MANQLLQARESTKSPITTTTVGLNWASNFVRRRPELRTQFTRVTDHQRIKAEDSEISRDWFRLVHNIVIKYGIIDDNIYNFDETGFMMGMISSGIVVTTSDDLQKTRLTQPGNREWATVIQGVNATGWTLPPFIILAARYLQKPWFDEILPDWRITITDNGWTNNEVGIQWIKHFDQYTASRTKGVYRLLILDGHESHHSIGFETYCRDHNIITLCMPAHTSHYHQPLDVSCFGPLKIAYGHEIEYLIRVSVTHITKLYFLTAFRKAFFKAITPSNIQNGFAGTGLVPYNP
jgi:hypothetical protein